MTGEGGQSADGAGWAPPATAALPVQRQPRRSPWVAVAVAVAMAMVVVVVLALARSGPAPQGRAPAPGTAASTPPAQRTSPSPSPSPGVTASAPPVQDQQTAVQALRGLELVLEGSALPDYDREAFGPRWADTDRNGCDTRNDVLRRDLADVEVDPVTRGCVALAGTLTDPYTGQRVAFRRGEGPSVEVDHVVALADAWRTGAHAWPYARLVAFANDPLVLLATASQVNQAKSDSSAQDWLPPDPSRRCRFAARQVSIKARYGLGVTPGERTALQAVLSACPAEPALEGTSPTTAPIRSPRPTSAS